MSVIRNGKNDLSLGVNSEVDRREVSEPFRSQSAIPEQILDLAVKAAMRTEWFKRFG